MITSTAHIPLSGALIFEYSHLLIDYEQPPTLKPANHNKRNLPLATLVTKRRFKALKQQYSQHLARIILQITAGQTSEPDSEVQPGDR